MMAAKVTAYTPKKGKAGVWAFVPNASTREQYPDATLEQLKMDLQDGESLSIAALKSDMRGTTLVVAVAEGRVELEKFTSDWQEVESSSDDDIVWDINRMLEEWSADE
jgi:hypothetical protein